MRSNILSIACLIGISITAHAQVACPSGWIPYSATSCGPAPRAQAAPTQQASTFSLATTWGAIATDGVKGVLGTAIGGESERGAAHTAMADCQAKGGTTCKVQLTYSNGCGAMIVGSKGFSTAGAGTKEEAIQKGMAICQTDGDTACRLYYTDCSLPKSAR
ncbi:DUF4189 domain-containing protein [Burkholderia cenocepacia]|nr:DUF4189 domain-containing protein [Burkholderia cenocepacia]RQV13524.1 DUF4189 domain-containing protein [Burkholderia cenocepacia]RQV26183.1 DUF4189 domain-containing protein [Burkholderia cenocepacia]RQV70933.1 DUF4189 domain-containing protein [Burkholderia cenocepacia]RQZ99942.1 DUF4189 domain-containing protein [Burkholderia cenocepacia]